MTRNGENVLIGATGEITHYYPVHALSFPDNQGGYVELIDGVQYFGGDLDAFLDNCCTDLDAARKSLRAIVESMPKVETAPRE